MKARYMTYYSYIGTLFRSSQKVKEIEISIDPKSVQGQMETALLSLRPINYPNFYLSSRTDGGVHALNSSAHFDLECKGDYIYEPDYIIRSINKYFGKNNIDICMKSCVRVNDNFSARYNAIERTYLFRLGVLKPGFTIEGCFRPHIPIEEWKRCEFVKDTNFDIEKLKEATKYLVGFHDFATFRKCKNIDQKKSSRRYIKEINVSPGCSLATGYSQRNCNLFNFWDIEIIGKSFVHNQIRRMMGFLIHVAVGKSKPEDVKLMLQIPSKNSWNPNVPVCHAGGLYLCNVKYAPEDLVYVPEGEEKSESVNISDSE